MQSTKSIIVGTAGHIDHGKTSLVKALTGIDADRLEEEKRRGITIDLGFAHLELPGANGTTYRFGFVDVPGHEKFVRNMLAGVGGIDLVLLVIAADEGIKPQTREHFEICRLLQVQRGITVLTKSDAVDSETLGVVKLEVEDFLRGSFLDSSRSPVVPVSSKSGAGFDDLKTALVTAAAEAASKDSSAIFRLPIDRVFTMKGFGSVVTGTLVSGSVKKEDEVEIFPLGRIARIRGIEVHGEQSDGATAGQRTALNLAGFAKDDLARGMTLASPGLLRTTDRADVQITLLKGVRPLKLNAAVHFHCHTSEMTAEVVPLEGSQIDFKQPGFAQLRFPKPLLLLPGDRFILRQFSPVVTIGGGVVLDAFPLKQRGKKIPAEQRVEFLGTQQQGTDAAKLLARIERRAESGLSLADASAESGLLPEKVKRLAVELAKAGKVSTAEDVYIATAAITNARSRVVSTLDDFHKSNPLSAGMNKEELAEKLGLPNAVFDSLLQSLFAEKKLSITGDTVILAGRGVVMKDEEAEAKRTIEDAFSKAGLKVPGLKEVVASLPLDKARAQKLVTLLLRDRVLIKLGDDLVFHRAALDSLKEQIRAHKAKSAKIDVATFKDLTGVSRKYAIPLLEHLDRERITRREGDARVIL